MLELALATAMAMAMAMAGAGAAPAAPAAVPLESDVMYFVMVDRFFDGDAANAPDARPGVRGAYWGGDLEGLRQKLPYLEDLGVSKVWITPIYDQIDEPQRYEGVDEHGYHGYWAQELAAPHIEKRWGNEAVLRRLLDDANARGIGIVLDVVLNHTGFSTALAKDARMARSNDTKTCPDDAVADDINRCLFGLPDLRTEDPAVRKLVVDAAASWAERYSFAGFRLDTYKHVEPEVFAELTARAERVRGSEFLVVAEAFGLEPGDATLARMTELHAADTAFDFSFTGLADGLVRGRMRGAALLHHLGKRHEAAGPPLAHFLDSHDVTTFITLTGADRDDTVMNRYPLAATLMMTVRGIPVITWGNEVARPGGAWPENRTMIDWQALSSSPRTRHIHSTFRSLIKLRRASPALTGRSFVPLAAASDVDADGGGRVSLAYLRGDPASDREVFVVAFAAGEPFALDAASPFPTSPAQESAGVRIELAFAVGGDVDDARAPAVSLALSSTKARGERVSIKLAKDSAAIWRITRR